MRYYTTNKFKSVLFYVSIFLPLVVVILTMSWVQDIKNSWPAMLIFYPIIFLIEYLLLRYRNIEVTINEDTISIKNADKFTKAKWTDIMELKEYLYGHGQLLYELKTKDKKTIGFNDSIDNCSDLLQEIESRTGLKFKQRL